MSRASVITSSTPYRICGRSPVAPPRDPDEPLVLAQRIANRFVVGWALLRLGVCALQGLDIEGFFALVIVVTAVQSLVRSLA